MTQRFDLDALQALIEDGRRRDLPGKQIAASILKLLEDPVWVKAMPPSCARSDSPPHTRGGGAKPGRRVWSNQPPGRGRGPLPPRLVDRRRAPRNAEVTQDGRARPAADGSSPSTRDRRLRAVSLAQLRAECLNLTLVLFLQFPLQRPHRLGKLLSILA